jgi:hypothetical protein
MVNRGSGGGAAVVMAGSGTEDGVTSTGRTTAVGVGVGVPAQAASSRTMKIKGENMDNRRMEYLLDLPHNTREVRS